MTSKEVFLIKTQKGYEFAKGILEVLVKERESLNKSISEWEDAVWRYELQLAEAYKDVSS